MNLFVVPGYATARVLIKHLHLHRVRESKRFEVYTDGVNTNPATSVPQGWATLPPFTPKDWPTPATSVPQWAVDFMPLNILCVCGSEPVTAAARCGYMLAYLERHYGTPKLCCLSAVDGVAVDGTAADGTAADGVAVDGVAAVDGTANRGLLLFNSIRAANRSYCPDMLGTHKMTEASVVTHAHGSIEDGAADGAADGDGG